MRAASLSNSTCLCNNFIHEYVQIFYHFVYIYHHNPILYLLLLLPPSSYFKNKSWELMWQERSQPSDELKVYDHVTILHTCIYHFLTAFSNFVHIFLRKHFETIKPNFLNSSREIR